MRTQTHNPHNPTTFEFKNARRQVRRVYFVLHHVLKELASKRLAADQRNFAEARGARAPRLGLRAASGFRAPGSLERPLPPGPRPASALHQTTPAARRPPWPPAGGAAPTPPLCFLTCRPLHGPKMQITSQLMDHVWGQWCSDLTAVLSGLPAALAAPAGAAAQPLLLHFERWLLLLKVLRRLVVFGYPSDARTLEPVPAVAAAAPALLRAAAELSAARPARAPPGRVAVMVDRGVLKLLKALRQIQEAHPW
jgi:hypothetical protein